MWDVYAFALRVNVLTQFFGTLSFYTAFLFWVGARGTGSLCDLIWGFGFVRVSFRGAIYDLGKIVTAFRITFLI